jgi:hypothetical protein
MISLPHQKRATMKIASIVGTDKMVSHPHGIFVFDHRQNIRPFVPFPAKNVFIPDIGVKVGKTAFTAALTKFLGG